MKRILFALLVILYFNDGATGQFNPYGGGPNTYIEKNTPDYRKINWGMTQKQVITIEGEQVAYKISDDRIVCYNLLVQNHVANLDYLFEKGKLVEAIVWFQISDNDPSDCVRAYQQINTALNHKYGTPHHKEVKRIAKSVYSDAITDLAAGRSFYTASWSFKNTKAVHTLGRDNGIRHLLTYSSADYAKRKQQKAQSLDDL